MKYLSLLIAAVAIVLTQCERHSWEDVTDEHGHVTEKGTKRLFEAHGAHGGEGADKHGTEGAGHDKDAEAHGKEGAGHDKDAEDAKTPEAGPDGEGQGDH